MTLAARFWLRFVYSDRVLRGAILLIIGLFCVCPAHAQRPRPVAPLVTPSAYVPIYLFRSQRIGTADLHVVNELPLGVRGRRDYLTWCKVTATWKTSVSLYREATITVPSQALECDAARPPLLFVWEVDLPPNWERTMWIDGRNEVLQFVVTTEDQGSGIDVNGAANTAAQVINSWEWEVTPPTQDDIRKLRETAPVPVPRRRVAQ